MLGHLAIVATLVAALGPPPDSGALRPCDGPQAQWPATVRFLDGLERHATRMLRTSETARRQCRAIASRRAYVRVQIDPRLGTRSFRARSVVYRTVDGPIVAFVSIGPTGDPAEWIAHELEHVIEQLEGVRLETLRRRAHGAWESADRMFESDRAIRVGRLVRHEIGAPGP